MKPAFVSPPARRPWLPAAGLLIAAAPLLQAHMVSISAGLLQVEGSRVRYELRMPLYEVESLDDPAATLGRHFRLSAGDAEAAGSGFSCREEPAEGWLVCTADYSLPQPPKTLTIACTYYAVTIPNHVHVLRARRGDVEVQRVFDFAAREEEIRFVPPTPWELFFEQAAGGAKRVLGGLAPVLFLAALVLAGRTQREMWNLAGAFAAGQGVAALGLPLTGWSPQPRFVEAAAALTIAYLAVEILLLPQAGRRDAVVGVLGLFHGLALGLFVESTAFSSWRVLTGALAADLTAVAVLGTAWWRAPAPLRSRPVVATLSAAMLAFGIGWFAWRLR